jgi:energy-coupling factor transporter ATP-binding protein EcfA2
MTKPQGNDNTALLEAIDNILDLTYFGDGKEYPIKTAYEPGEGMLLVVTGENASGKSFFARLFSAYCKARMNTECMRFGMDRRTESGIASAMMYGDETWESTGVISVRNLFGAEHNSRKRQNPHFVVFDEPDIGLAESYQAAVGKFIADFVKTLSELARGVVVVTHSRAILRELLPLHPHHLRCGDERTLKSVVEEDPVSKTIEELRGLPEHGGELFRRLTAMMRQK